MGDALFAQENLDRSDLGHRQLPADGIAVQLLDLDDAGTEVGEKGGTEGSGEERAELENCDPVERQTSPRLARGGAASESVGGCRGIAEGLRPGWRPPVVTVEFGHRAVGSAGRVRQGDERRHLAHHAPHGVGDLHDAPVVEELRMREDLAAVAEDLGEDIRIIVEHLLPFGDGSCPNRRQCLVAECRPTRQVFVLPRALPLRSGQVDRPQERLKQLGSRLGELQPTAVRRQPDHEGIGHPAVRHLGAGVDRRDFGEGAGVAFGDQADHPVEHVVRSDRLHERGIDPLTNATPRPFEEASENSLDRELAALQEQ